MGYAIRIMPMPETGLKRLVVASKHVVTVHNRDKLLACLEELAAELCSHAGAIDVALLAEE